MASQSTCIEDVLADPTLGHLAVLGATGTGKSVLLEQIGTWAVNQGHRVISLDAYGNNVRLARQRGGRSLALSEQHCLNPLDIAYDDGAEEGWLRRQVQHAAGVVRALLSDHVWNKAGSYETRLMSLAPGECGALDLALTGLYERCLPATSLEDTPTLSNVISALETQGEPESLSVALALREVLCTTNAAAAQPTAAGRRFDGTTTIPWDFSSSLTAIATGAVPEQWRPLVAAAALGAALHFLTGLPRLLRGRAQQRVTYVLLDPFDDLVATAVGGEIVAELARRAKPLRVRLVAVGQRPANFLETTHGRFVWENADKVLFRLRDVDAQWVANELPVLQPEHLRTLHRATPGHGFTVVGDTVQALDTELSPVAKALLKR